MKADTRMSSCSSSCPSSYPEGPSYDSDLLSSAPVRDTHPKVAGWEWATCWLMHGRKISFPLVVKLFQTSLILPPLSADSVLTPLTPPLLKLVHPLSHGAGIITFLFWIINVARLTVPVTPISASEAPAAAVKAALKISDCLCFSLPPPNGAQMTRRMALTQSSMSVWELAMSRKDSWLIAARSFSPVPPLQTDDREVVYYVIDHTFIDLFFLYIYWISDGLDFYVIF